MKLEDQVCSLELAQRLKELDIKQDGSFYWLQVESEVKMKVNPDGSIFLNENGCSVVAERSYIFILGNPMAHNVPWEHTWNAFTVAELGEMLPNNTEPLTYWTSKISTGIPEKLWTADILFARDSLKIFYAESEANLRAEMLIYLLENNLMKVE